MLLIFHLAAFPVALLGSNIDYARLYLYFDVEKNDRLTIKLMIFSWDWNTSLIMLEECYSST